MPTEIHEALTSYTGNPPPPGFSFDGILAAGRRRRRTRRLAGAGALTAVALGVALTVPSFLPRRLPYVAPPAPASICPTPSTEAWMNCYLAATVPPLLPGATIERDPSSPAGLGPLVAHPAKVSDPVHVAGTSPLEVSASAYVISSRGPAALSFATGPSSTTAAAAARDCARPQCTVRTGPRGETVIVIDSVSPGSSRVVTVQLYRGRTMTSASASILVQLGEFFRGPSAPPPPVARLPLTADQLITLASGLALHGS